VIEPELVAAKTQLLALRCREHGLLVTPDGRCSERSLAVLLGLDDEYVARLRLAGEAPPFIRLPADARTRVSYDLGDVARWLVGLRECAACRAQRLAR
jgi:hypothetical protein